MSANNLISPRHTTSLCVIEKGQPTDSRVVTVTKRWLLAVIALTLVAGVSAATAAKDPVTVSSGEREQFIVSSEYVGPTFDGELPVIQEGDGFEVVMVIDGVEQVIWQAGDEPLNEGELATLRSRLSPIIGDPNDDDGAGPGTQAAMGNP